jgi:hypothetical protein
VLNRDENLVINPVDRFQQYSPPDGRLGECLSGSWYKHAWEEMEKDGICDYMIPIILYIDKTQISISGKLSIFPVQMSLGIFTEKASSPPTMQSYLLLSLTIIHYFSVAGPQMPGGLLGMWPMKMCFSQARNGMRTCPMGRA